MIEKTHWYPAFLGAMELEFIENKDKLIFDDEHELSKKPLSIDLLIIKKEKNAVLKNQIGHIFKEYNVIEYKSPDDGLTIDDYSKAAAYAFLFKALGKTVNEIPFHQLILTLIRDRYPRELFKIIKSEGGSVEEKFSGIYYITNYFAGFPTQVIVTHQLDPELHTSLRLLTTRIQENDVKKFITMLSRFTESGDKQNADAVLKVSMSANKEAYEKFTKEELSMYESLKELMKDEFEKNENRVLERVATDMLKNGEPIEKIKIYSRMAEDAIRNLAKSIGVALA